MKNNVISWGAREYQITLFIFREEAAFGLFCLEDEFHEPLLFTETRELAEFITYLIFQSVLILLQTDFDEEFRRCDGIKRIKYSST